ncbi:MAG: hypothetical protein NZ473_03590 [Candidatus Kapabacteria bacterium]|nr:hypothetical protein [Candidatus Kapabacteria bacterium]MCS7169042.1 hypothetical protein [Candidatus Kapabacteria bacterium]MDW7997310.1 hypothetical protein [Bacteroidota bacterium]MDW8224719.1 hypothetical protein [Bacteroidota bacterium]
MRSLLAVSLCLLALPVQAQYATGIGFFADVSLHTADFRTLAPDIPNCCPGFETATGFGWGIFGTYDGFRLAPRLRLLLEANYRRYAATFLQQERTTVATSEGTGVSGTFEHELQTRLHTLATALLLGYNPLEQLPQWQLRLGVQAGWTLQSSFHQRERLVEPPYGYFMDTGTRTRNEYSGSIPTASPISLAIVVGTRYLLPLVPRQQLALQPALTGWLGLTHLVTGATWRAHAVAISLSVVYAPLELPSPLQPGAPQ